MNIDLNLTTFREYFIGLSLFSLSLLWLRGAPKICISAWNQTPKTTGGKHFPGTKEEREEGENETPGLLVPRPVTLPHEVS